MAIDIRYAGMSYEQASREADRLLKAAILTGNWMDLPERLSDLRAVMLREFRGGEARMTATEVLARRAAMMAECDIAP